MSYVDGDDNADWTKQTLDFFVPDGAGSRRVRDCADMRESLRMSGMTVEEFKRLPAYRVALHRQPWLLEL